MLQGKLHRRDNNWVLLRGFFSFHFTECNRVDVGLKTQMPIYFRCHFRHQLTRARKTLAAHMCPLTLESCPTVKIGWYKCLYMALFLVQTLPVERALLKISWCNHKASEFIQEKCYASYIPVTNIAKNPSSSSIFTKHCRKVSFLCNV